MADPLPGLLQCMRESAEVSVVQSRRHQYPVFQIKLLKATIEPELYQSTYT